MELAVKTIGRGFRGKLHVMIDGTEISDDSDNSVRSAWIESGDAIGYSSLSKPVKGTEIGTIEIDLGDGIYRGRVRNVTGRHALYFVAEGASDTSTWTGSFFKDRVICELEEFVFLK